MASEHRSERDADNPMIYQFRLKGHLGQQRMDWFDGLTITLEDDGNTLLHGPVIDQSALHGILKKIRDLEYHCYRSIPRLRILIKQLRQIQNK